MKRYDSNYYTKILWIAEYGKKSEKFGLSNVFKNHLKPLTTWFYRRVIPKYVEGIGNSIDPDQSVPGSALFLKTCLSKNFGSFWYSVACIMHQSSMMDFISPGIGANHMKLS